MLPPKLQRPTAIAAPLVYAAAIFVQSSFEIPVRTEGLPDHVDKLVHLLEYGLLGFLLQRGIAVGLQRPATHWWLAGMLGALYGASDELHQLFVPGRSATIGDLLADLLGAFLGAWLAAWALNGRVSGRASRRSAAPAG